MKILRQKSKVKTIVIITVLVILLAGAAAATAFYFKLGPFAETQQDIQTKKENQTGSDIKKQSVDNSSKDSQTGSDPSPAPKPVPGTNKSSINAEITSANQDTSRLRIRILIQTVTSDGSCTLTMQGPDGKTYSATAGVQALPSTSTCKGFDIPLSQLSSGSWTIKLTFSNTNLTASATKAITIQ